MGVPFEALIPFGIMLAMFGVTGAGLSKIRHMQNGGKRARHSLDQWDRVSNTAKPWRLTSWRRYANDITANDGSGSAVDGHVKRADRQRGSPGWIRAEQSLRLEKRII